MTELCLRASPTRTCVGCRKPAPQDSLLRLQIVDGEVALVSRALAGRSAYVHADAGCVESLSKSRGLERSLRAQIGKQGRNDLISRLQSLLSDG